VDQIEQRLDVMHKDIKEIKTKVYEDREEEIQRLVTVEQRSKTNRGMLYGIWTLAVLFVGRVLYPIIFKA